MTDRRHAPYRRGLRQPREPSGSQVIPTGDPPEGCPVGDLLDGVRRPFCKRQREYPFQVVCDVTGRALPFFEEWGHIDVGDPNRLGVYKLLVPDPSGTGTFADGSNPEGQSVRGWNGSLLVT